MSGDPFHLIEDIEDTMMTASRMAVNCTPFVNKGKGKGIKITNDKVEMAT